MLDVEMSFQKAKGLHSSIHAMYAPGTNLFPPPMIGLQGHVLLLALDENEMVMHFDMERANRWVNERPGSAEPRKHAPLLSELLSPAEGVVTNHGVTTYAMFNTLPASASLGYVGCNSFNNIPCAFRFDYAFSL